jgi:hypothetical protein
MSEKVIEFYTKSKQCDRKAEVEKLLTFENDDIISKPVKVCRQNSLVYAAVQITDKKTKEKKVVAKIFVTSTNLKWDKKFIYEEYSEDDCPDQQTCPSSILKKLTPTENKKAKAWRRGCKDILEGLAVEKLDSMSLTNLPVDTRIKLIGKKKDDGDEIVLVKDIYPQYSYPVWVDEDTDEKYKICDIQSYGYEILERG